MNQPGVKINLNRWPQKSISQNLSIVEQCMPRIKTKQKWTVISQRCRLPITSEVDICGWVTASKPCPLSPRWPACMSQSKKQTSLELLCQLTKQTTEDGGLQGELISRVTVPKILVSSKKFWVMQRQENRTHTQGRQKAGNRNYLWEGQKLTKPSTTNVRGNAGNSA